MAIDVNTLRRYRFVIHTPASKSSTRTNIFRVLSVPFKGKGEAVELGQVWRSSAGWVASDGTCTTYRIPTRSQAADVLSKARALPRYGVGETVAVNAPKHDGHGMHATILERKPRTVGQPGDVYKVRFLGVIGGQAHRTDYFDTEELNGVRHA
jgi:hypothetical protein